MGVPRLDFTSSRPCLKLRQGPCQIFHCCPRSRSCHGGDHVGARRFRRKGNLWRRSWSRQIADGACSVVWEPAYQARLRLRKGIWSDIIAVLHDKESNCKHLNSHGLHICVRQVRDMSILPMERDALMQRSYFHDGNTLLNVYIERILDEGCN